MGKIAKRKVAYRDIIDLGTPERARHGGVEVLDRVEGPDGGIVPRRAHVKVECVLDAYWHRCQISDPQRAAGLKFRELFEIVAHMSRVTAKYGDRMPTGLRDEVSSRAIAARDTLKAAHQKLGMQKSAVLVAVCGMNEWAGGTRRLNTLRDALSDLARDWGITA